MRVSGEETDRLALGSSKSTSKSSIFEDSTLSTFGEWISVKAPAPIDGKGRSRFSGLLMVRLFVKHSLNF